MAEVNFNFKGKKALVTGGSRGIGRDIVQALITAHIDKVYVLGRDQKTLDDVKAISPAVVETIAVDLSDWEEVQRSLADVEPVNFLINNAGVQCLQSFYDVTEQGFDKVNAVNVKSVISVSQVMCAKMEKAFGGGVVVNVSSQASLKQFPSHLSYCASKAATDSVTRQMAFELSPKIRVNAVNPTVVLTALAREYWDDKKGEVLKSRTPMGRFAELDEVTKVVLFLLSDGAGMIDGARVPICGGLTNV